MICKRRRKHIVTKRQVHASVAGLSATWQQLPSEQAHLNKERARFRSFKAHRSSLFCIVIIGFRFRGIVKSNDNNALRRSSIEGGYILSAREIAPIDKFCLDNVCWTPFLHGLVAGSIGYFISLDYNIDRAFGLRRKTMRGDESKSQSTGNHQRCCVPNFHS